MDNKLIQARKSLDRRKILREDIRRRVKETKQLALTTKQQAILYEKAVEILRQVGLETQRQLQIHISDITTMALESVFGDEAYQLIVDFVERRNKTECDLIFERDGNQLSPLDGSGYGAVDVASFALRVASWTMIQNKTRNVIILDEPFRFLDKERQKKASLMITKLSETIKLQFIIVTHEPTLTEAADKIFEVTITKDGISKVESRKNERNLYNNM